MPGAPDAEGVYQYAEDDVETQMSDLLNLLGESVSQQLGLDRARLDALETHLPLRVAAGAAVITGNNTSTRTVSIVFPVGRFSVPPIVLPGGSNSSGGAILTSTALNITTTGCDIRLAADVSFSSTYTIPWIAVQMTAGSAAG